MAEEGVHLCITLGWTSAIYQDKLQLRLPEGVLLYIEVLNEFYFSLEVFQEKKPKKINLQKKKQILYQQTIEIKQLKQRATLKYNYSSSQTVDFHPLLRASRDHSTFQP